MVQRAVPMNAYPLPCGLRGCADQPRWDSFMRLMEPLSSTLPMLTTPGNHEIERQPQAGGMRFMAYNYRYPNPSPTVSMYV